MRGGIQQTSIGRSHSVSVLRTSPAAVRDRSMRLNSLNESSREEERRSRNPQNGQVLRSFGCRGFADRSPDIRQAQLRHSCRSGLSSDCSIRCHAVTRTTPLFGVVRTRMFRRGNVRCSRRASNPSMRNLPPFCTRAAQRSRRVIPSRRVTHALLQLAAFFRGFSGAIPSSSRRLDRVCGRDAVTKYLATRWFG